MKAERLPALGFLLFTLVGCGGGTSSTTTTTTPNNPVPSITSISPSSALTGASSQALTITGTNFMTGSTVTFNGAARTPTFVSATQLTITLTASDDAAAGLFQVVVTNPAPGGGASNVSNFAVNNPQPVVNAVSPTELAVGSPDTAVTVTGNAFLSNSTILLNGSSAATTFVSSTQLTATLPASLLSSGASISVAVSTASPGGGTSTATSIGLVSVGSLAMLATPDAANDLSGPWQVTVVAKTPGNAGPAVGLPIALAGTAGALNATQGVTDSNGAFATILNPPGATSSTVGVTATIGTQHVNVSISFGATATTSLRFLNSANNLRKELGLKAVPQAASTIVSPPVAIGISNSAPGSTSPFAVPNYCFSNLALSAADTATCNALYQQQGIGLQPMNPMQAGCQLAEIADTTVGITECLGAGVTIGSCIVAATGVGSVATAGTADAICAGYVDLTATTLAPDCATFILNELTSLYSPSAAEAEDLVELSVDPIATDPLDYAVTYCSLNQPPSQISSTGVFVAPVAGNGTQGNTTGPPRTIELNSPTGIVIDSNHNVYFDDDGNNAIKLLTASTQQVANYVTTGLNAPTQVTLDASGNLYISDAGNNVVRKVTPNGTMTIVAGTGTAGFNGDGPVATKAELNYPDAIAIDSLGNLFIADTLNQRIREVTPGGAITTVAGTGTAGFNGDNQAAVAAELNKPTRVVVDSNENLYIADSNNNRVRKVDHLGVQITTIAGTGSAGYSGDQGPATNAQLNAPLSIALDLNGNLYIADLQNNVIRAVNLQSTTATLFGIQIGPGDIDTVVGGGSESDTKPEPAKNVRLSFPTGLIVDSQGFLYFADADNNVILRAH